MENFCDWYTIFAKLNKEDINASKMSQADKDKYTRIWSFNPNTPGFCNGSNIPPFNLERNFSKPEQLACNSLFDITYWFIAGQGLGDHDDIMTDDPLSLYKSSWDKHDWSV